MFTEVLSSNVYLGGPQVDSRVPVSPLWSGGVTGGEVTDPSTVTAPQSRAVCHVSRKRGDMDSVGVGAFVREGVHDCFCEPEVVCVARECSHV